MVDPTSSRHQTSFPLRAGAPLPHVTRGRRRKEGTSPKPLPRPGLRGGWVARSLQAAQGHPGGEAGWWLVVSLEAGLPLPRTHVPSTPIWSAWAESLSLLCKKQKQLVAILENPRDWAACFLSWPLRLEQEPRKWQLSCPGDRGPQVVGLTPLWGSSLVSLESIHTPSLPEQCQMGRPWLMASPHPAAP